MSEVAASPIPHNDGSAKGGLFARIRPSERPDSELPPFLEASVPPFISRLLAWILLATFVLGVVLAATLALPETVSGRFVIQPVRGSDPLKAPRGGIVTQVHGLPGQPVHQGELLLTLASEGAGELFAERETVQVQLKGLTEKLENLRRSGENRRQAALEETRSLKSRLQFLMAQASLAEQREQVAREISTRYEQSFKNKLISWEQNAEKRLELAQAALTLSQTRSDLTQAQASLERLSYEQKVREEEGLETARGLEEEASRLHIHLKRLDAGPVSSHGAEVTITAPCDGQITTWRVRAERTVVQEGEVLGQVLCHEDALQAEVELPDAGVGLLRAGMHARLFYDAFPYQRHGVAEGRVRWIGPVGSPETNAASTTGGPSGGADPAGTSTSGVRFVALIDLEASHFRIDGRPAPILTGMAGRADVVVARRTPLSYLFEPMRALKASMTDPE